ncbi:hypothetical protein [Acinetobacter baretiae]|uniref:hypothetical protein n=1 Tax=Acinetobacter baretiae TaxID=2605383 RepID=UPI001F2EF620|nr:hypothetical protein [Acinetobacter baretiae]
MVRAATDSKGDIVLGIPFDMRAISTPNNETLLYTVAYYSNEVNKSSKDTDFPAGSLNGKHTIYVRS